MAKIFEPTPTTYAYKGITIDILIGGYRFQKLITLTKQEMEDIIDAIIEANKLHNKKVRGY